MHHSPLQISNSYLIKVERPSLSSHLSYEPQSQYIANQSGSTKETEDWQEYWDVDLFYLYGAKRWDFDWYQTSLSNYDEST